METKLTIVNHLLKTVGERKTLTLETAHPSVVQAIDALESWDRDFQGKGWWFNKNKGMTLSPTNTGEVLVPAECLEFVITQGIGAWSPVRDKTRYVRRGNRLWDSWDNTWNIGGPVKADLVIQLAIEELPQAAASYLKHLTAENYYVDDDGDLSKAQLLKGRTQFAWNALKAAELKAENTNALDSPQAQYMRYRIQQSGSPSNPTWPGGRV